MMPGSGKPLIEDPHHVRETFITSVVDVALIGGTSVAVTLGMRRHLATSFSDNPQEVVIVNNRLVLTLDAARNLVEAVTMMLARAQALEPPPDKTNLS
jgi:hypothetical protein